PSSQFLPHAPPSLASCAPDSVFVRWRHGPARPRRLLSLGRPQQQHEYLGRREHLRARGREYPWRSPAGARCSRDGTLRCEIGKAVHAVIVLRHGKKAAENEIMAWCSGWLAQAAQIGL